MLCHKSESILSIFSKFYTIKEVKEYIKIKLLFFPNSFLGQVGYIWPKNDVLEL